jgi:hypothetical protein
LAHLRPTFEKYSDIWKDPAKLEWLASAFVSIDVEALVQGVDDAGRRFLIASSVAYSE